MEFTLLVNNTHGCLLSADVDRRNVVRGLAHRLELRVEGMRSLDGSLCMEFGRVRDLEEYVLHDVGAIGALEFERLALEENVVEAPGLSGEDTGESDLSAFDEVREVDRTGACISSGPGFTRTGVGSMTVGTERLTIDPSLRDGVDSLLTGQASVGQLKYTEPVSGKRSRLTRASTPPLC